MIKAYKQFWTHYLDFGGRTTVGGFWWAALANIIVNAILSVVFAFVNPVFASAWSIITFIPSLTIMIRRFRDGGKKWFNIFWFLLPLIGWIIIILLLLKPSKR